ncbi:MAG: DUF1592 domain-containing protein [Verrucomicrobiota bacterium]
MNLNFPPSTRHLLLIALLVPFGPTAVNADPLDEIIPFLDQHCTSCHDDLSAKGGLNLLDLEYDPSDPHNLELWALVHDHASSGKMPPEKRPRPAAPELTEFIETLEVALDASWKERYAENGRTGGRRLNPTEYENTLRDLLAAPWLELKPMLPPDPSAGGFDNVAQVQELSYVQMARYLDAAEVAIDGAMQLRPPHKTEKVRTWFSEEPRYLGKGEFEGRGVGEIRPTEEWLLFFRQPNSAQAPYRIRNTSPQIPGWYRFRVRCNSFFYDNGTLHPPKRGHVAVINTAAKRNLGKFDLPRDPDGDIIEFVAWQHQDELLEFFCATLDNFVYPNRRTNPNGPLQRDGIGIDWFEIEGPFANEDCVEGAWPPESCRRLFGDLPIAPWTEESGSRPPQPLNLPDWTANKRGLRESYQLPPEMMMVVSENPEADAERLLRDFMARAYRRAPEESEVQRCLSFALEEIGNRACFQDAMRPAFKAVLCSPDFLYFRENAGELDDAAIASRLSYLLWRSLPDTTLFSRAKNGSLRSEEGLREALQYLLTDPKSERFFSDLVGQWLNLRAINDTAPDRFLFPEYHCDTHLVESGLAESTATFEAMVRDNLPSRTVADADFVMINERLAELYEIEGVQGHEIQRVSLPADSVRGGFLTQSSVLKVTANGLTSSPILRGGWVVERILGKHLTAPPPDAGAIEPDTQGAKTIRELLDLHSRSESCATCHKIMDPPGFALENFDVMGAWREHYRSLGEGTKLERVVAGRPVRYKQGLPVHASGITSDGVSFEDIEGFKAYLLTQERKLARNLAHRLTTFATGSTVSFYDRHEIESILDRTEPGGFPVRDLLKEIILSETFRTK